MEHLSDQQLLDLAGGQAPSSSQTSHLDVCGQCRRSLAQFTTLLGDLQVDRLSTPDAATLARYYALAGEIQTQPSGLSGLLDRLVAVLSWDGRAQLGLAGQRGAAASAYRLLYSTPRAEIELMIEQAGVHRDVEGDLIPLADAPVAPALIQLDRAGDGTPVLEVETTAGGRFHLRDLPAGHYRLNVYGQDGSHLVVEALDLS
jgi:hypothetical protein